MLFVGRLLPHKGIDDLVNAVPDDMDLDIASHPLDPHYLESLRTLARGKRVVFHHDYDDSALVDAYRQALCVVLPSVYRSCYGEESRIPELLGQTLLEAMACATPAICTNVASMPEIIRAQRVGSGGSAKRPKRAAASSALVEVASGTGAQHGRCGETAVEAKLSWPVVVHRCLDIYKRFTTRTLVSAQPREMAFF